MNNNKFNTFKSQEIFTSRKKMIFVFRYIKKLTLKQARDYFYCLNKKYSKPMFKFVSDIIKNLSYVKNIKEEEAEQKTIQFVVIEKGSKKSYSLRYAAKGRAYRCVSVSSRVKMYIN